MQQLRIGFNEIHYRIERSSRRRTVCITVHPQNGVVVKAPPWAAEDEIELFVRQKASWISKHLTVFSALPQAAPSEERLSDGAVLPLLGRSLNLRLSVQPRSSSRQRSRLRLHEDELHVELRLSPGEDQAGALRGVLTRWYRQQARHLLYPRLAFFAAQLGLPEPELLIREQRSRWGSCNRRGEIRINWRILLGPAEVADYLIAHEVCHLKQMNHSPRFWRLVARLVPDYKALRQKLKLEGHLYSL
ncbi:M48 family metallopeptidase [bacterium]|nr:M48 family metallopeptidase [bacterium]